MDDREVKIFALFSDDIHSYDLRAVIKELQAMKLGSVFPLSVKDPTIGVLILGVKENLLDCALSDLNNLNFIRFADMLPQKVDPSRPSSSCSLKKDK